MGVYFHTISSVVWLGRQCVMALFIRPCNGPASSEPACLSFLIAFNPIFWRKRRKNQWRKIYTHPEGPSSWLVPQKSNRDRWHCCNRLAKVSGIPHSVISALFFFILGKLITMSEDSLNRVQEVTICFFNVLHSFILHRGWVLEGSAFRECDSENTMILTKLYLLQIHID